MSTPVTITGKLTDSTGTSGTVTPLQGSFTVEDVT
jgi:hypothetical protein